MTDDERDLEPGPVAPAPPAPPTADAAARLAAHAEITRLADELLPALVARLGASGLGELEVREAGWRVRLRLPPGPRQAPAAGASRGGRAGSAPQAGPRQAPAAAAPIAVEEAGVPAGPGAGHGPGRSTERSSWGIEPVEAEPSPDDRSTTGVAVTAPAVGFYQPRAGLAAGSRVRAGERLGTVDVLGVPQDVVAPADGLLGVALVEPGEPVEYGQEIAVVERLWAGSAGPTPAGRPAGAEVGP